MLRSILFSLAFVVSSVLSLVSAQDVCTAPYTPVWDDYTTCGYMYLQGIGIDSLSPANTGNLPSCASFSPGTTPDSWVRFTVPPGVTTLYLHAFNADLGFDLSGFNPGSVNPTNPPSFLPASCAEVPHLAIAAYRGSDCNSLTEILCAHDPPVCLNLQSLLPFPFPLPFNLVVPTDPSEIRFEPLTGLVPGETIWVRTWDANETGSNYFFAASEQSSLPEDDCDTPQPLLGGACNILSTGGDVAAPDDCGWSSTDNSTFYTFTVDPSDPQPYTINAENTNCYGNPGTFGGLPTSTEIQMAVYSYNGNGCADIGGGGPGADVVNPNYEGCAQGTGTVTFSQNLPPGDYVLAIDGLSSDNGTSLCTYGINLPDPPIPAFSPDTVCAGVPVTFTDQSSNTPTGWTWTFTGGATPASSTQQDPSGIVFPSAGTFDVTLEASNQYGSNTLTKQIVVLANQPSSFTSIGPFCDTDPAVALSATPSGGTFSGPGVTGSQFDPAAAGVGSHTLTYSGQGVCGPYTETITVAVNAGPTASIDPVADLCPGDPAVTLTATPAGGSFSGTGVTGNQFDPSVGQGTYTITYSGTGSCGAYSETIDITVLPPTVVNIDPIADLCTDATPVTLTATPAGGSFSGPGVTGTQFDPAAAGAGTHTITYAGSDACGPFSGTIDVTVIQAPAIAFTLPAEICVNDPASPLTATPTGGTFSGPGVSGTQFDPGAAGLGTHSITYTYTDFCGTYTEDISVDVINTTPSSIDAVDTLCVNGAPITLTATPTGGTFSGPGVSGNQFDPNAAGLGTHTILYDGTGNCGAYSASIEIEVTDEPTLSFTLPATICDSDAPLTLSATPAGGTFTLSGNPITAFDPTSSGTGLQTITYSLTHPCGTFTADAQIDVLPTPVLTIDPVGPLCENGSAETLTASPAGGTFSGPGVSTGAFTPSPSLVGTNTISYAFNGSCGTQTATLDIEVEAIPTLSTSASTPFTCENGDPITLSGTPAGGTFSGAGVSGNTFDPDGLSAADYTLDYELTTACGTFNEPVLVTVQPTPVVDAGAGFETCAFEIELNATGSGANAAIETWSVVSLPTGAPQPNFSSPGLPTTEVSNLEVGSYTFEYAEDLSGCVGSDVVEVEVLETPAVESAGVAYDCANGTISPTLVPENGVTYTWYDAMPPAGTMIGTGASVSIPASQESVSRAWVVPERSICVGEPLMFSGQLPTPLAPDVLPSRACLGDPIAFRVEAPEPVAAYAYNWQLTADGPVVGSGNSFEVIADSNPTNVFVSRDSAGCVSELTAVRASPVARVVADFELSDSIIGVGEILTLTDRSQNANTLLWELGDGTTVDEPVVQHAYSQDDTVTVTLTASNGLCADSVRKTVVVEGWSLQIPNAFTPNGDNMNDNYGIVYSGLTDITFKIFNRWGRLLGTFVGTQTWDGSADAGACSEGVYVIVVDGTVESTGQAIQRTRTITLIR